MMTYTIDNWNIRDFTGFGSESFVAQPGEWGTAVFEDRIKENSYASGKLNVVTCMP
jgi:hypothetical protein